MRTTRSTQALLEQTRRLSQSLQNLSDSELRTSSLNLQYKIAQAKRIQDFVVDAFALVLEASRRSLGMTHYDVQVLCGLEMAKLRIAEMKTGEGKTLTATLPAVLFALARNGAHVASSNDYLAGRDADLMRPVYAALGLSVGVVQSGDEERDRRKAYQADITYGTTKEFGFDFLRDRMTQLRRQTQNSSGSSRVMRDLFFILVDEADNNLIDEARTPLIIALPNRKEQERVRTLATWASSHVDNFQSGTDFRIDPRQKKVQLLPRGMARIRILADQAKLVGVSIREVYRSMETAIHAQHQLIADQHYMVVDGKVLIIDEFTGRATEGRQWQRGIHQAVEAKEGLEISSQSQQAAGVTIPSLCQQYRYFAGMTGTAWTSKNEFKRIYKKRVRKVPTRKAVDRTEWPARIFVSNQAKFKSVSDETKEVVEQGRAVLIGTKSLDNSERLSILLRNAGIEHEVLNAKNAQHEANIVKSAGQPGRVTIATNMAGRGTDIGLADCVREAGGLHVILTEIHESSRIDWQLIGRGSRQGDPGSFRVFVSLEDDLLRDALGADRHARLIESYRGFDELPASYYRKFQTAQRRVERRSLIDRLILKRQEKERQDRLREMGQDPFLS